MIPSSHSRFGIFNTEARIVRSTYTGMEYQIGSVTDGDYAFGVSTGLVPSLIGIKEIPGILVVGIGYNNI